MKKTKGNKFSNVLKLLCMLIAICGFVRIAYIQHKTLSSIDRNIKDTNKQLVEAQRQRLEYINQKKIINSRAYIERVARDKYNMVKPGDKIFVLEK